MTVFATIQGKLVEARKAKDNVGVTFWGTVLARVKIIEKGPKKLEFTDENVVPVLNKLLKETKETLEMAKKGGREEAVEKAEREVGLLEGILPADQQPVSDEELRAEIVAILSGIPEDEKKKAMGTVMKALKEKYGNRFDGKTANTMVRELIS